MISRKTFGFPPYVDMIYDEEVHPQGLSPDEIGVHPFEPDCGYFLEMHGIFVALAYWDKGQ